MSIEAPAEPAIQYLVGSYTWHRPDPRDNRPAHWYFDIPERFTEFDLACAHQNDMFDRAARQRTGARARGRIVWRPDAIVWRMQPIENPAEYHDAPEYNTSPPRGGYVVYCEKGDWSVDVGFCGCFLRLGEAQAWLAELQRRHPKDEHLIYEIKALDNPVEVPQTMFVLGQHVYTDGWAVEFGYGYYATLADARAAVIDARVHHPDSSPWLIYETVLVETETDNNT